MCTMVVLTSVAQQLTTITLFKSTQLLNSQWLKLVCGPKSKWDFEVTAVEYISNIHFKQNQHASTLSELAQQSTAVVETVELDSMHPVTHTVRFISRLHDEAGSTSARIEQTSSTRRHQALVELARLALVVCCASARAVVELDWWADTPFTQWSWLYELARRASFIV